MQNLVFSLSLLLFTFALSAQTKMLTMEEAVLKQKNDLAPKKLLQLGWIQGTDNYYFIAGKKKDSLMIGNAEKGPAKLKVTLKEINIAIKKFGMGMDTVAAFPIIKWTSKDDFQFDGKSRIGYNINKGGTGGTLLNHGETERENLDNGPKFGQTAFTKSNNLFVEIPDPGMHTAQITNDKNENIVNGKSVHREEWGISKGTFWSPEGNYLAFYRMDESMVTDYPIMDLTKQPAQTENIKYPMAGGKSHEVTVGVFEIKTQKTIFLKTGEPKEQYLINPTWTPDEKHIYITVLNREQNHLKLNSYNAQTGEFEKTLFEEKNEKYVHPMNPPLFVKNHPDLFIWQSEREGFNAIYIYKADGTLIKQLTNFWPKKLDPKNHTIVTEVLGFDEKGDNIYYIAANSEHILGREIRKTSLDGMYDIAISSGDGTHSAIISPTGKYMIDTYSSPTVPRTISIIDAKGVKKQTLLNAENPLKEYKLGKIKIVPIKAADNETQLFLRITYPTDFDSTKKYPVIDYLYNGPNIQIVNNSWLNGSDLWFQYMAQQGYIVVSMDGRGSGFRGLEFEQSIFDRVGTEEMNDQLKVVDYLKTKKYVDATRIGIFGWSYGGFMSTTLMTRSPGIFKVGVAGGPVIDWSYYEIMYTERYMDTPQTNKTGYDGNNLLNFAQNLKGKLLLIHGASDPVVLWQHSLLYIKKCVDLGKQVDYFVYPGHEHNVMGKDRVHLYQKITDYFNDNL